MTYNSRPKLGISFKKLLIDLNLAIDSIKWWTGRTQFIDYNSTSFLRHHKTPIPQIATDILILEDRRYFKHHGFEWWSIPRGIKRRWNYGRVGGISTIEQQLVRTISQRRERTARRKYREIVISFLLNLHVSKEAIFASYLNSVYFGPRLHGIDIASAIIFGQRASNLDASQSAVIASLLPYPVPVKVSLALRRRGSHFLTAADFLSFADVYDTQWANRIRRRVIYLEKLRLRYSEAVWRGFRR